MTMILIDGMDAIVACVGTVRGDAKAQILCRLGVVMALSCDRKL
jgi:hypothetical protein